jgi:hypothetical protein
MELLPIIYWSLLVVGILTVIVVIISFITFQFRKRFGHIPSAEVKGNEREKKIKITNPDKREKTEKKHHPKVQTRSRNKKSSSENSRSKTIKTSTPEEVKLYKKPTRDMKKKRIEILNPGLQKDPPSSGNTKYHPMDIESKHKNWK